MPRPRPAGPSPSTGSSRRVPRATAPPPGCSSGPPRALGHLAVTFAGALQTTRIVLAGEDVAEIAGSPALADVVADRLRPGADETQRCALDITTATLTFNDWARGTAVAGVQHVLGAL
jgi:hypothetical protein